MYYYFKEVNNSSSDRSYAFIVKNENKEDIERLVNVYVEVGSTIITDEHVSYKGIKNISDIDNNKIYNHKSVNHSEEYQNDDGINTNFAESYFSRLRRMVIGQHHKLSKKYFLTSKACSLCVELYVNEITYRENVREWNNRDILIDLIKHCMNCSPNINFNGYWDRNNTKIKDFRYFEVGNKDYVEIENIEHK